MLQMLVRNRVEDYDRWKAVFDGNLGPVEESGMSVAGTWRDADDPQVVWFLLDVADRERAEAFTQAPEAAAKGEEAGVLEGEIHWLEPIADG